MEERFDAVPSVTVVIPTFRRPEGLERVLRSLAGQVDPGVAWDVLVVDNDPPSATPSYEATCHGLGGRSRLLAEEAPGPSHARNRGIREATGSIVALLDDDVVPEHDWLARLVEPILDGRCDATAGRVLLDPAVPRPRWLDEVTLGSYLSAHTQAEDERDLLPGDYVVSSNAAFRTELLRSVGGFDPGFGPQHGRWLFNDDVLLGRRFAAARGRIRHVPAAVVVHDLPPQRLRPLYLLRRAFAQGRSDWLLQRDVLVRRPLCGMVGAIGVFVLTLGRRLRSGIALATAFVALCDAAWAAGAVRQAAAFLRERSTGRAEAV